MNQIAINIDDEATVLEIAKQAVAKHLHVITNGQRSVLSPIVHLVGLFNSAAKATKPNNSHRCRHEPPKRPATS